MYALKRSQFIKKNLCVSSHVLKGQSTLFTCDVQFTVSLLSLCLYNISRGSVGAVSVVSVRASVISAWTVYYVTEKSVTGRCEV